MNKFSEDKLEKYYLVKSRREDIIGRVFNLALPPAPKTVAEALSADNPHRDKWGEAILDELSILDKMGTFGKAEQTGRAMKIKFVFTVVYKNDFSIKFKARLVACGYS
jgi:hypothetical protein